jgi:hypothetical protein
MTQDLEERDWLTPFLQVAQAPLAVADRPLGAWI